MEKNNQSTFLSKNGNQILKKNTDLNITSIYHQSEKGLFANYIEIPDSVFKTSLNLGDKGIRSVSDTNFNEIHCCDFCKAGLFGEQSRKCNLCNVLFCENCYKKMGSEIFFDEKETKNEIVCKMCSEIKKNQ